MADVIQIIGFFLFFLGNIYLVLKYLCIQSNLGNSLEKAVFDGHIFKSFLAS